MTRYLVTDNEIRCAINEAISEQDRDRQGPNYVIRTCGDVINHVLRLLDKYKVAEEEQTENSKEDAGREPDTSDYPVVDLKVIKAADLVDHICHAYRNGLAD